MTERRSELRISDLFRIDYRLGEGVAEVATDGEAEIDGLGVGVGSGTTTSVKPGGFGMML